MNLWHDLETGPKPPDVVNLVVEIPKGSRNKAGYHDIKDIPQHSL